MHEVLVNRLGGLSLPRKSVVRLTDRLNMTLDVYHGRKTTMRPTNQPQPGIELMSPGLKCMLYIPISCDKYTEQLGLALHCLISRIPGAVHIYLSWGGRMSFLVQTASRGPRRPCRRMMDG